jgi:predicted Zn-dependent peptidase
VSGWYAGDYAFDGSTRSYDDYFRDLKAVTPEEVQRLAERFLISKRHAATLVGKVSEASSTAVAQRLQGIWQ